MLSLPRPPDCAKETEEVPQAERTGVPRAETPVVGTIAPWDLPKCRVSVIPSIPNYRKRDHTAAESRVIAQAVLDALPPCDVTCF